METRGILLSLVSLYGALEIEFCLILTNLLCVAIAANIVLIERFVCIYQ